MKKKVASNKGNNVSSNNASKVINRREAISKLAAVSTGLGIAVIAAGVGGYLAGTQTAPVKTVERTVTAPATEKTVTVERTIEKTVTATGTPVTTSVTTSPAMPVEELVLSKLKELEPKTPVTLRCWALSDVPMDPVIAAFNEVFPNVKITKTASDDEVALMSALRTGAEVYDVLRVQLYTIPTLASLGLLEDISQYIIPELVNGIPDWALASSTGGLGDIGKTWFAVPQDVGPCLHAYRKDIFSKFGLDPPRTWEEYAEAARKIHKTDSNVYITAADTTVFFGQIITSYMQQVDGGIARPIGKGQFEIILDSPQNRRVAEYWGELIDEGLLLLAAGFSDEWIRAVKEDKVGFHSMGSCMGPRIRA
jgi:multiple sugar transport system substrate-binding protein